MTLRAGDKVDRYTIEALLGSGGMGECYRAEDYLLQRTVALKVLKPQEVGQASALGTDGGVRMLREACAAAALEHPNVVTVFDVGEVTEPEILRGTMFLA